MPSLFLSGNIFNRSLYHTSFCHVVPIILFMHDLLHVIRLYYFSQKPHLPSFPLMHLPPSISFPSFFMNFSVKILFGFLFNFVNSFPRRISNHFLCSMFLYLALFFSDRFLHILYATFFCCIASFTSLFTTPVIKLVFCKSYKISFYI